MNNEQTIVAAAKLLADMEKKVLNDVLMTVGGRENTIQFGGVAVRIGTPLAASTKAIDLGAKGHYMLELTINGETIRIEDTVPLTEITREKIAGQIAGAMLEKIKYEFLRRISPELNKIGML